MIRRWVVIIALVCAPFVRACAATDDAGGKWQLAVSETPDGAKIITARLPAEGQIPSGFGRVTPELVIRYHAGRADALVDFDTYLGTGKLPVAVALGAGSAELETWTISNDGRSAAPPGKPLAFIERLKTQPTLSLHLTSKQKAPIEVEFTTRGIEVVLKALISAGVKYAN